MVASVFICAYKDFIGQMEQFLHPKEPTVDKYYNEYERGNQRWEGKNRTTMQGSDG